MEKLLEEIAQCRKIESADVTVRNGKICLKGHPIQEHYKSNGFAEPAQNYISKRAFKPNAIDGINFREFLITAASTLKKPVRWINRSYNLLHKARPIVLAKGDSWLDYPTGETTDIAFEIGKYLPVFSLSRAGDEIKNYVGKKNLDKLKVLVEKNKINCVVVSGGGNDIIAEGITKMINTETYAINASARERILNKIIAYHQTIYSELRSANPSLHYFTHAYAAPFPNTNGPWIGNQFKNTQDFDILHRQIDSIIDTYCTKLTTMCQQNRNFHYLDLRDHMGKNTRDAWVNEIHLKVGPLTAIGKAFESEIRRKVNP